MMRALVVSSSLLLASSALAKPPKPIKKPPTEWKLAGKSLSTIDNDDLEQAIKSIVTPLGYTSARVSDSTACVWEGKLVSIKKGASEFSFFLKRPWAAPDDDCNPQDARGPASESISGKNVGAYDKKAEVSVSISPNIDGTTTPEQKEQLAKDSKQLFEALVKK